VISIGLSRFDPFGRLVFVSRIGPKPWDVDMDDALERRYAEIAPVIENIGSARSSSISFNM
jgi:hypothetical protein